MKTIKRKARIGESIVITDPQKGWNAPNDDLKGSIMVVNDVNGLGIHTDETGKGFYISHDGYEVIVE